MATPPKDPTDTTTATPKPPAPRKPATPRKSAAPRKTARKTAATSAPVAKPAARKPSAPRTAAPAAAAPSKPATTRKPAARRSPAKAKPATGTSKWGLAAVIGGVGAALTAGLLALRGSTPTPQAADDVAKPNAGQTAHQADGSDSSASFEAGIADEGTIPE